MKALKTIKEKYLERKIEKRRSDSGTAATLNTLPFSQSMCRERERGREIEK